ncbi:MAG: hypothetical protein FJX89_00550 [Bacteroidetes bacterium]|nr:hypothetical protein [Bacteroidota bacterium]
MIPLPLPEIKQCFEAIGAINITVQEQKDSVVLLSVFKIRNKPTRVLLIISEVGGQALFQLFATYEEAYEKPGIDFYEVLDNLNTKLVLGHVQVRKQANDWRVTYRSNFVGEPERLFTNHCFRNFISFSVDMVGAIEKEFV